MNLSAIRRQMILNIIELHNHMSKELHKKLSRMEPNLWNKDEYEMKPDRYYLVEELSVDNSDYDNKTFKPQMQVRRHLRSQERRKYGTGHDAYYKGYLSTHSFSPEEIENVEEAKKNITLEIHK